MTAWAPGTSARSRETVSYGSRRPASISRRSSSLPAQASQSEASPSWIWLYSRPLRQKTNPLGSRNEPVSRDAGAAGSAARGGVIHGRGSAGGRRRGRGRRLVVLPATGDETGDLATEEHHGCHDRRDRALD